MAKDVVCGLQCRTRGIATGVAIAVATIGTYSIATHAASPAEKWPAAAPERGPADPLQFALTADVYHDNNLFRLPGGDPRTFGVNSGSRSDTISRLGASVRYENLIGRQSVLTQLGIQHHSFQQNDNLDHVAGNALGRWLWRAGSQWDGELSYEFRRQLASFAYVRSSERNLLDRQKVVASGGYRPDPRWRVWGGLNYLVTDNNLAAQMSNDMEISAASAGVDYTTPADDSVGVHLRRAAGRFPNRESIAATLVSNEYDETTTSLAGIWNVTAVSRFDGRVGYTRRSHDQFPSRDYSGPTLVANYRWLPTTALRVDTGAWRELWTAETQTSSYVVAKGLRIGPTWSVTSKVSLRGGMSYETRAYQGDPGIALGTTTLRDDTVRTYQLALAYGFLRNSEFTVLLEKGSRNSNQQQFDYDYNALLLRLRLGFF
jgi:exopolysaccharide biosynthesis operon protein EpsL